MRKTKLIAFAMVLAVILSSTYAKPKKQTKSKGTVPGTAKTAGWTLNTDKPIQLDWYINFSWFARHWGDSMVSKYITQKTGVDINFIVPAGNESEKLNSMIAGDALPDLITIGWWEGQVPMMIDAGLVEPLDELA